MGSAQFRIREAQDSDASELIGLIGSVYAEYPGCVLDVEREEPDLLAIASVYQRRLGRFWVATSADDGSIIGCVAALPCGAGVELRKLYVAAAQRRGGLATRLLALVEAYADERNAPSIELWSDTRFHAGHRFYQAHGFSRSGETRELGDLSCSTEFHFAKPLTRREQAAPLLRTLRCVMRLATLKDIPALLDFYAASAQRYDPPFPRESLTYSYFAEACASARAGYFSGRSCRLYLFASDETQILGSVVLNHVIRAARHAAWLSYAIAASHEGQGLMREACEELIRFAFDELNLHRIEASYDPQNERSARLLTRLGFSLVGVLPEFHRSQGKWHDSVLMTRVNRAWRAAAVDGISS